jgi:hypothetical protein
MNQELYVFLIGMLGDNLGGLDDYVQALLQPMYVCCQTDEILKVHVTQDTIGCTSSPKRGDTVLGNPFQCSIPPLAKLLIRIPDGPRN